MTDPNKHIIEINGIKLEVDLRQAKKIEHYKVGDNVKVLIKEYSDYASYPGVIVGFDQFENLPTIVVCYYKYHDVKWAYINNQTKDIELCHMGEHEKTLDKQRVTDLLDEKIARTQLDLDELKRKKNYFIEKYNEHFVKEI